MWGNSLTLGPESGRAMLLALVCVPCRTYSTRYRPDTRSGKCASTRAHPVFHLSTRLPCEITDLRLREIHPWSQCSVRDGPRAVRSCQSSKRPKPIASMAAEKAAKPAQPMPIACGPAAMGYVLQASGEGMKLA